MRVALYGKVGYCECFPTHPIRGSEHDWGQIPRG